MFLKTIIQIICLYSWILIAEKGCSEFQCKVLEYNAIKNRDKPDRLTLTGRFLEDEIIKPTKISVSESQGVASRNLCLKHSNSYAYLVLTLC